MTKLCTAILFSILFISQGTSQVLQSNIPNNNGTRQIIHGEVPEAIRSLGLKPTRRLASTTRLNLVIGLPMRNQDALKQLIQEIYNPSSPNYHKYLSSEGINLQFGPSLQDYQALIAFAETNNFKITQTHNSRMLLEISGTAANIENVFNVHMYEYKRPESNDTFYAPDVEPSINLSVPVQQIKGLNNYLNFHPNSKFSKIKSNNSANPNGGSAVAGLYIGDDFRNAYAPGVSLNGIGQSVGLLQFDGYNSSDISKYEQTANRPTLVTLQNIYIGGFKGTPQNSGGQSEVTLDIDMSIAMAPGLTKVVVFEAPNNTQYFDVILDSMAAHPEIKQLSTSWSSSADYTDQLADSYFERMAVQGQSFFCASGDHDAYNNSTVTINGKKQSSSPGFPESDTNITEVGGTLLGMKSNGGSWSSDRVWNTGFSLADSLYWGSSGGASIVNAIPSWQKALPTTNNNRSTTKRNIPDVALTADSIYINIGTNAYIFSGTSCAAPLWAGFTALVNQQAVAAGQPTVGFINSAIYRIGNSTNYTTDFHDVTSGNNEWPGSPNLYSAVSGYDLATGWGTPNGQNLIDDLSNSLPGQLSAGIVNPASGGITTPFSFSINYVSLTNQAPDSINVVVDNKSYKMSAQGNSWKNGVLFSYAYPAFFSAGQHNYYFLGSISGSVSIRYPSSGTLQFNILNNAPAVVQQVSPFNNSLGIIQPVQLKWMSSAGAGSYRLQFGSDSTFAATIIDTSGLTDTSLTVNALSNLTTYYWRVMVSNITGSSAWSSVWNFKTLGNPTQAVLIYPAANSQNIPTTLTFQWNKSQDQLLMIKKMNQYPGIKKITKVSRYWFELTADTARASYVINDSALTDTVKQVSGLHNSTDYWWRVSAKNETGWGSFTSWNKFTTIVATPGIVTQVSPLSNSVGNVQPVQLKWISSAGTSSYRLQLGGDSTFAATIIDTSGLTDTSLTVNTLSNLTTYDWRVNASNITGTSVWSPIWNFKTLGNPTLAVLIYPSNNSLNIPTTLTFQWNKSQDQLLVIKKMNQYPGIKKITKVSRYWFELTADTAGASYVINDSALTDTVKQVSGLHNSTDYWWRVSAKNETGWGSFTSWNKFTTNVATPGIVFQVSPLSNSVGNIQPVQLTWMTSTGAISYRLQVSTDSTFKSTYNDTLITDTTCAANRPNPFGNYGLSNLTKYYWRVNATNIGGTSPWSQVWNFTTLGNPAQVVLIYPGANSVNIPVALDFKWNKTQDQLTARKNELVKNAKSIASVSQYWFELTADTASSNYVQNIISITDTTVQVTGLQNLTNYWWRVSAMNETGWGAFADWTKFTTVVDTPGVATLLTPNSSSTIIDTATSILFRWKSASFASTYEFQISSNKNFNTVISDTSGIKDTVFIYHPKNLTATFYWRVRGNNIAGTGSWSSVNSVSIISGIDKLKSGVPAAYALYQNYPNPFNPNTVIRFALPFSSNVKIEIYNILGEKVREILNEQKTAGYYEINFNTVGLASGVYLYLLQATSTDGRSQFRDVKKMMLLK
jgi:hypothetical protein